MTGDVWTVPGTITKVVDGDTCWILLDLGWRITLHSRCRLIGVNAPELATDDGQAARMWVIQQLHEWGGAADGSGITVTLISHKLDKYGRPLGQVILTSQQGDQIDLASALMQAGHAVPMAE